MNNVVFADVVDKIIDYRGKTPKKLGTDWKPSGIPAISAKNIKNGSIIREDTIRFLDQPTYEKWMKDKVVAGDVLMTSEAPLGETYYVKSSDPFVMSQRLFAIRTNPNKLDSRYFYLLTKTPKFQNILRTFGTGTTAAGIRQALLWRLPMTIMDIKTQVQIADVVWDYDALIENNLARIAKLEQMAQLLYQEYFKNPDESWEGKTLDDVLVVHRGKSYKGSELSDTDGVDLVNLKCFNRGGGFRKDGLKKFVGNYKESQVVRRGDIVLCNTDMTQERMIVARSALVPTLPTGIGVVSHHVYRIEVQKNTNTLWLYSFLRWSNFPDIVKNHANGANVLGLARERITDFETKIPPKELQDDFAQKARPIFDLIDTLEQKNEKLKEARDLLLPRLMSGEISL